MLIIPMCYWFIIFSLFIAVIHHHYYHLKKKKHLNFIYTIKRVRKNLVPHLKDWIFIISKIFGFLLNLHV